MTARKRAGAVGAIAGLVAVGAAAGLAAERYAVGRARLRPDPEAREPFFQLPADRVREVVCDDGVRLHVEEVGPEETSVMAGRRPRSAGVRSCGIGDRPYTASPGRTRS
jgi:hypothetical protein